MADATLHVHLYTNSIVPKFSNNYNDDYSRQDGGWVIGAARERKIAVKDTYVTAPAFRGDCHHDFSIVLVPPARHVICIPCQTAHALPQTWMVRWETAAMT